jgi:pimeloyl-ACP methyl ester carboxylesterase
MVGFLNAVGATCDRALYALQTLLLSGTSTKHDKFVTLPNGAKLRYLASSDSEDAVVTDLDTAPLVFCMDGPNVLENFVTQMYSPSTQEDNTVPMSLVNRDRDVLAFEPRGTGMSLPTNGFGFTVDEYADDCIHLLRHQQEQIGYSRFVLVFTCYSAYVAQRVAKLAPELVAGVVITQAPSIEQECSWMQRMDQYGLMRTPILGQILNFFASTWLNRRWFGVAVRDRTLRSQLTARSERVLTRGGAFCFASLLQSFAASLLSDDRDDRFDSNLPCMVIWGTQDRSHTPTDMTSSSLLAEGSIQIVEFEGSGHFPELEEPVKFMQAVATFVRQHSL